MKLTIQAADLLRFRRLASTLMAGPRGYFLNLTEYRGGLALALDGGVWALVMPIRGRRPAKPFRIPLAAIWHLPATISGKVVVQIEQQKGFGKILWYEDGWDETAPFPFGPGNFDVQGLPPEPSESQNCPASLLGKLTKCSRICQKAWPSNLAYIRITPGGEIGATDGKRLLLLETEHRFLWSEPVLVRATELFRQPEFQKSFGLGVRDAWVRLDFGDCVFFTRPEMERFPDLRKVLPTDETVRTRLIVAPKDATYDAAQTTPENARHWAMADGLSADGSMTPEIRRTLRNRARLEVANNAYARGMVLTLADVCIGTGPRLQMLSDDEDFNSIVEEEFVAWAEAVRLAEKLKTLRMSKIADGEAFAAILKNPRVKHPVEIDIRPIEADRVTTPYPTIINEVDGIQYDRFGNPEKYHVSSEHPGDSSLWYGTFETIPADYMIHWYRADRPGQSRGLPEIMPALPLFAQLRRYTLAVLAAAETAADFAAVMYTDAPASDTSEAPTPYDLVSLEKRMLTVMPDGWKIGQIRAEQPTTSYSEFKREILGEIGRCMQVPVNILLGDSSKHNYASGRLDHQSFFKSIKVEQTSCEQVLLFPVFDAWYREAIRLGLFREPGSPQQQGTGRRRVHNNYHNCCWFWDGMEHVDPLKEAKASAARIDSHTSNLAIECAKQGLDWEDVLDQAAKERQRMIDLGLNPDTNINTMEKYQDEKDEIDESDAAPEPDQTRRKRKRGEDS